MNNRPFILKQKNPKTRDKFEDFPHTPIRMDVINVWFLNYINNMPFYLF